MNTKQKIAYTLFLIVVLINIFSFIGGLLIQINDFLVGTFILSTIFLMLYSVLLPIILSYLEWNMNG